MISSDLAKIIFASGSNALAAAVKRTECLLRMNSFIPKLLSKFAIYWLRAGCVINCSCAALVKFRCFAREMK
jgi:hypothetical protein